MSHTPSGDGGGGDDHGNGNGGGSGGIMKVEKIGLEMREREREGWQEIQNKTIKILVIPLCWGEGEYSSTKASGPF